MTPSFLFFLKMYGHRSTKENLESLMSATDLSRSFIQPAGLEVILDLFPITRHFPSKAMTGLKEARDKHIFWLTREIENRRVCFKPFFTYTCVFMNILFLQVVIL